MNNKEIIENVEKYYINTVYPICPKYVLCKRGNPDFSKKPKMSYIGREYGSDATIPNLLFLSLDSGRDKDLENYHTINEIRESVETNPPQINPGKDINKHWYQTFDLASILLGPFLPDEIRKGNIYVNPFIVHVNSAKCTQNKANGNQADNILFQNCKEYILKELELYYPDIIITQGNRAVEVLNQFPDSNRVSLETIQNSQKIQLIYRNLGKKRIIHIPMFHPRHWGYWGQKSVILYNIEKITQEIRKVMK